VTAPAALLPRTIGDDVVPFGPLTFVQETTQSGFEAIARLHDEAMSAIASIAEEHDRAVGQPAATATTTASATAPAPAPAPDDARVLRMADRAAVTRNSWGIAAA
jgi:hypothetical protein